MLTGSGGMWIRKGKLNHICRQAEIEQRNMGISSSVVIYDIYFFMLKFLLSISMENLHTGIMFCLEHKEKGYR
jgi:hypothetical protein